MLQMNHPSPSSPTLPVTSLAEQPGKRRSDQTRPVHPEGAETPHPRAIALADYMREAVGGTGGVTYAELVSAGFTSAEICEHEPVARKLCEEALTRQVTPEHDRVPEICVKAIDSIASRPPLTEGMDASEATTTSWKRYCAARAAFKLDPWISQSERCIHLLKRHLEALPLLEREANRVIYALAAEQKARLSGGANG